MSASAPPRERTAWRNRIVGSGEAAPGELVPNEKNWRLHPRRQVAALEGALDEVGWVQQVIVNQRTGRLVDGHARVESAVARREATVPVLYVDLSEAEEALVLVSLDPLGAMAETNQEALDALLASVSVSDEALRAMLAELGSIELVVGRTDPDDVGDVPVDPWVAPGELYALGDHRLLCGDATDPTAVARLVGGQVADLIWTDPPYGVSYVGKTADRLRIANDDAGAGALLASMARAQRRTVRPGGAFYVASPAGPRQLDFLQALAAVDWRVHQELVWVKDAFVLGHSDYHYQHEPILYGYLPGAGRPGRGRHTGSTWQGDHAKSSVLAFDRPRRSETHPTMKPVALVAHCLANSAPAGGLVLDPFLGSGSTLIAAEQLGLACLGMELDPRYVQVAIERWQAFTGREAVRVDA
jgi:DNA modification methylase